MSAKVGFTLRDGPVMTIAALCETWHDRAENQTIRSCAVVITEPNAFVAEVHDRMPVVLEPHQFDQWMNGTPDKAAELMKPAAEDVLRSGRCPSGSTARGRRRTIRR